MPRKYTRKPRTQAKASGNYQKKNRYSNGFGNQFKSKGTFAYLGDSASTMVVKSPSAVADTCYCTMKYSQNVTITAAAVPVAHLFRGNSIFDPDFTAVGHQPLGRDEWSSFYNSYLVLGMGYRISVIGDETHPCLVAVIPKPNSDIIGSFDTLKERAYSNVILTGTAGSAKNIQSLTGYISTKKIFGLRQDLSAKDSDYSAGMSGNPVLPWYLHMYAQAQDRSSSVRCHFEIELTYYVKLYSRANLIQS